MLHSAFRIIELNEIESMRRHMYWIIINQSLKKIETLTPLEPEELNQF